MLPINIDLPPGFLEAEPKTLIVSKKRKELWAVVLDLVMQLDRVCKKHGIRYFCDGGTSLGAARHKGFIPWDDDLDVIMSREEYQKLCSVAPGEFTHPYFWQTNETDPGSARGHAQLRNSETTGILKMEMREGKPIYHFNQGLFIDVFPFDHIPDDESERKQFISEMKVAKCKIHRVRLDRIREKELKRRLSLRSLFRGFKPMLREWWARRCGVDRLSQACLELDSLAQKYDNVMTREMAPISFNPEHREVLPSHFFDEATELDFEFVKLPVLKHYKEALAINYGNWREHVIGGAAHGGMFVDVDHPYTDYLEK